MKRLVISLMLLLFPLGVMAAEVPKAPAKEPTKKVKKVKKPAPKKEVPAKSK